MPRWPRGYKKKHPDRNYAKETAYESRPEQRRRRNERTKARNKAISKGIVRKGDGKELDHVGSHRTGSLANVPTRVVSRRKNRMRQPATKARGRARNSK